MKTCVNKEFDYRLLRNENIKTNFDKKNKVLYVNPRDVARYNYLREFID